MSVVASSLPHSRAGLRPRTGVSNQSVIAIGRGTLIGAGVALCGLAAWAAGATWWLVNRDAVAAGFLARQSALQYAYEDRIAALRAQIDRVASQRLMEQNGLEGRVSDLIARQVQLETRQAVLTTLAERAAGAPGGAGTPPARAMRVPEATAHASALPGAASAYAPAPKTALPADFLGLRLREAAPAVEPAREGPQRTSEQDQGSAGGRLAGLDRSLRRVEAAQAQALDGLVRTALTQVSRIRTAVIKAGLDPNRLQGAAGPAGGPLVPLPSEAKSDRFAEAKPEPFERLAAQAAASFAQLESLRRATAALPFGRPMAGAPDLTSGFGARIDPFTRGAALHTGLDFRADYGAPVRAAGAGRVVGAEHAGGYGNMVEIDHGDGVTTRYAHLSAITVGVGQAVAAGTVVGRVGSTGRSTGAHLHYETRINDEPVDPQRFLRAGLKLSEAVESVAR